MKMNQNPKTFSEYINAHLKSAFQWGTHDCYTLVRRWLDLKYKNNNLPVLPKYNSKKGALNLSHKYDWLSELEAGFQVEYPGVKNLEDEDLVIEPKGQHEKCIQTIHLVYNGNLCLMLQGHNLQLYDLQLFPSFLEKATLLRIKGQKEQ